MKIHLYRTAVFYTAALLLLSACGEADVSEEISAPEMSSYPTDFTGVWVAESRYVIEGIAAGVPIQLNNTGWAPLSEGAPEEQQTPTFEEQKAQMESVIASNVDIFALFAQNRFIPPYSDAGLTAVEDMRASRTLPGSPYERCLPSNITGFGSARYLQKDDLIVAISESKEVRHVYLDGGDSANALPAYEGHSIGSFDTDGNLVVETTAFLGMTFNGWPMSSEARLIETLSLSEDGSELTIKTQYEDPAYLAEPVARMTYLFRESEEYELIFSSCVENIYGAQIFDEQMPDYINERPTI
ncbi:MAG: hypothetical protein COA71_12925 [SAR86 cluster bacterium]|uniref:DUF306 domain-containing protein n=1 Tax=SAR86 cluster bacterium TaxID=2030880 RepID=A0A2A5C7C7_9GAMM|nr:MAG: hypothetical protein COA71_12925 [SAR86 cluster bacterium]